jgi:predicted PurR-regulated permease PerM
MAAGKRLDPIYRAVLLAFGLFIAYLLFRELATFLIAILITILISIPLSAGATLFQRRLGFPRALGAFVTLLIGLGAIAGLLYLVIPSFVDEGKKFIDQLPGTITSAEHSVRDLINAKPGEVGHSVQHFVNGYVHNPERLVGPAASIGLNIVEVIFFLVVIVLTAFYIAVNPQPLVDGILALVPPDRREHAEAVMDRLRTAWIGWMQGLLVNMLVNGVLLYIGLRIIGLDYALVFAVLTGLFTVIPYFGAIAAGIPPVLFALSNSLEQGLLVLGIYILTHEIEGNVSVPLVMANRVRLHPAMVAIGVVIVGALFGFVGLFVAVPILSLVTILVDELWVKPMNARKAAEAGGERVTAGGLTIPPAAAEEEEEHEEVGAPR